MPLKNDKTTYGIISKAFHWGMALLMLSLILVGLYMGEMPNSPVKFEVYALHKSFGLLVLWLVGLRILWRFYTASPVSNNAHQKWEILLAKIAHISLYIAMFLMPITGWVMSSAAEYPVPFFGMQLPDIVSKNENLAIQAHQAHTFISYLLIVAVMLHVLGAFKHFIIDRDETLERMMVGAMSPLKFVILISVIFVFGIGVLKFEVFNKLNSKHKDSVEEVLVQKVEKNELLYNPYQWNIVGEQSLIQFFASVYNTNFTGIISSFGGDIIFNPNDLPSSKVEIQINLKTVDSGDSERDSQMLGEAWFNVADYPSAYFKTIEFKKIEEGQYIVVGNLTIAGNTMPISIPFTLDIVEGEAEKRAYMEGRFTLNRLDFDLGGEEWKSNDSVGHDVEIELRLVAENIKNLVD